MYLYFASNMSNAISEETNISYDDIVTEITCFSIELMHLTLLLLFSLKHNAMTDTIVVLIRIL